MDYFLGSRAGKKLNSYAILNLLSYAYRLNLWFMNAKENAWFLDEKQTKNHSHILSKGGSISTWVYILSEIRREQGGIRNKPKE